MDIEVSVKPFDQFGHHHRYLDRCGRGVDGFACAGVDHVVLLASFDGMRILGQHHLLPEDVP
jgi:hypothetical protein